MDKRIYNSQLWLSDLDIAVNALPVLQALSGKSVLVTGATGLICSAVVDVLLRFNQRSSHPIRIFLAGRSLKTAENRFGELVHQQSLSFLHFNAVNAEEKLNYLHFDYIIHGAGNATPSKMMAEPVETMLDNFFGMKSLLDCAKERKTKRVLYLSSSEVYGKKESSGAYRENEYGYVDLLNPRSAYPMGKRAAETLCISYINEYGVDCVIARPGHIYGPTASPNDSRVSSVWAHASAKGENIVMKSKGDQLRSYCYCLDCASAILTILIKGQTGCAYNISNPESVVTIKEMAEYLAKAGGVSLIQQLPTETELRMFNPMSNSSLESSLLSALGWRGYFNAKQGFGHTVTVLKHIYAAGTNNSERHI